MTNPIYAYKHSDRLRRDHRRRIRADRRVAGSLRRRLHLRRLRLRKLYTLTKNSSGVYARSTFDSGLGVNSAVAMMFGPFELEQGALLHELRQRRAGPACRLHRQSHADRGRDRDPAGRGGAADRAIRRQCEQRSRTTTR